MTTANRIADALFSALLRPFEALSPLVGLAVVSFVTALLVLVIFRLTSNQTRIRETKRHIQAGFFEIRLFNDDLGAILRAQRDILSANFTYMRLSLVPLLWMVVPLALLMAQLQSHYGHRGFAVNEAGLVKVRMVADWQKRLEPGLEAGAKSRPPVELVAPAGVRVETPGVWIPTLQEMDWRVRPERSGQFGLKIRIHQQTYLKNLLASQDVRARAAVRPRGLMGQILHPTEAPLPRSGLVESIVLTYPERRIHVLGTETPWFVVFFVLTLFLALSLRSRLGVAI